MATYNKDVDYLILSKLSGEDIGNFSQTNRYARSICNNDRLWKEKVLKKFGKVFGYHIMEYKGDKSWKEFYTNLDGYMRYIYNLREDYFDFPYFYEDSSESKVKKEFEVLYFYISDETSLFMGELRSCCLDTLDNLTKKIFENDFISPSVLLNLYEYSMDKYEFVSRILNMKHKKIRPAIINELFGMYRYSHSHVDTKIEELLLSDSRTDPNKILGFFIFYSHPNLEFVDTVLKDSRISYEKLLKNVDNALEDTGVNEQILEKYLNKLVQLGATKETLKEICILHKINYNENCDINQIIKKMSGSIKMFVFR